MTPVKPGEAPIARGRFYLDTIPQSEAYEILSGALSESGWFSIRRSESVPSVNCSGRITARPVHAMASSPHYPASAMDGVAVRSRDVREAGERTPIKLALGDTAVVVDTGDPVPPGYDAVVMWEDLVEVSGDSVTVAAAVAPWQHVRMVGEDVVQNEMLLPALHRLSPADVGALLAAGVLSVDVLVRPRIGLIPSGPELVPPGEATRPGDIPEYNSAMLAAFLDEWGGQPRTFAPVPDDAAKIADTIRQALDECDAVCLLAGSSAGRDDWGSTAIAAIGRVLVHGVASRPGKPVILAIANDKPVLGLPGYPVSAVVAARSFLEPLIARKLGQAVSEPRQVECRFGRRMESPGGVDEFVQVRVGPVGDHLVALPLSRGAGVVSALAKSDGLVRIPSGETGVEAGQPVQVNLYQGPAGVRRQILMAGSHDLTLDVLNDLLMGEYPPVRLASASLGSLGGLMALKRGEALVAGSHLLDPGTGQYNVTYAQKYLEGMPVLGLSLVQRQQGLMVAPGNPLGLSSLQDLNRPGVRFINRQRGSGTRVLTDWLMTREGIVPDGIHGYDTEEYTHLSVAAAVVSGSADAAMGILAAAQALGLDFIPVVFEQYDLVIPKCFWDDPLISALRKVVSDPRFAGRVSRLGGYTTVGTGEIRWQA